MTTAVQVVKSLIAAYSLRFEGVFVVWCLIYMDLWECEVKGRLHFQVTPVFLSINLLGERKEEMAGVIIARN